MKHLFVLASVCLATLGQGAFASCKASELSFRWPLAGADGTNWVINNYVDLDPGPGLKDWKNNIGNSAKTYNGHGGIDIDVPTFRQMDAGVPVLAAADGEVTEIESDLFDRNMEGPAGCGPWNHVYVKHANGFISWYGHLRQFSTVVTKGDKVVAGQKLGLVGSSGCSSTAHLHFEVRDCSNNVVDASLNNMFTNGPTYDTALHIMDMTIRKGEFPDPNRNHPQDALLKDVQFNSESFAPGSRIGVGLSVAGGDNGDHVDVTITRPNGKVFTSFNLKYTGASRHSWPRWWVNLPADMEAGIWKVAASQNGKVMRRASFERANTTDGIVYGVQEDTYQQNFQSFIGDSYRPIFVDGSVAPNSRARMTAIFRRDGQGARGFHNIDAATYQSEFTKATAAGLQPISVDAYVSNFAIRMAAVFSTPLGGKWEAYHLVSRAVHQTKFNDLKNRGFRPYAISVVVSNGQEFYTAAYTNLPSAGWTALAGLDAKGYQNEFDRQALQGRAPMYVKVYVDNTGVPRFSAIWTKEAAAKGTSARHGMDAAALAAFNETQVKAGMLARSLSSYEDHGRRLFAGVWSKP